jgi:hypothetical protein
MARFGDRRGISGGWWRSRHGVEGSGAPDCERLLAASFSPTALHILRGGGLFLSIGDSIGDERREEVRFDPTGQRVLPLLDPNFAGLHRYPNGTKKEVRSNGPADRTGPRASI